MNKENCKGCYYNHYNAGKKECMHLKDAKIVKRIKIGIFEKPPFINKNLISIPECYRTEAKVSFMYVDIDLITKAGYWKG